jgi:hypothetical protein
VQVHRTESHERSPALRGGAADRWIFVIWSKMEGERS